MSGRPKKPASVKALEGNPGNRPPQNPPPVCDSKAVCPKFLTGDAKRFWERYAPECEALGRLTKVDEPAFSMMCVQWANWLKYSRAMRKRTFEISNKHGQLDPLATAAKQAKAGYMELARAFLFLPDARSQAELMIPDKPDEEDKDFLGANAAP